MTRTVLLPKEIDGRLDNLTLLIEEVIGVLLYRRLGDYCPIEALLITGAGGREGRSEPIPERVKTVNEFFKRNPDYQFVEVHTHSRGTIA